MRVINDRELWQRYLRAQKAKASWTAEEKAAKAELLAALGYDPADEKPPSDEITDSGGNRIGEVKVTSGRRLDQKALRDERPDIYAAFEKVSYSVSVKADGE